MSIVFDDNIRRADSKGRISGFVPGAHYWIDSGEGVTRLTNVVREAKTRQPAYEEAIAYLGTFGIDGNQVCADDHDASGYWKFLTDQFGTRVVTGSGILRDWNEWPARFDYDEFIRLCNYGE